jgi:hypothetical protein
MKATFRLPDELMQELRRRSQEDGRSLNETAIEALWLGLGREWESGDPAEALGSFVAQRATAPYDPDALRRALTPLPNSARELDKALDWTRWEG